ncbi:hypothetical protein [Beijerinckia sp. L45]|uniref:hypothetical protein n=1 Tax=Beijerinckia sp. L45 TaxID=1641855 RepID=UPI00131A6F21|nr:hypothetical protein [Beijerinckia sp. L45]
MNLPRQNRPVSRHVSNRPIQNATTMSGGGIACTLCNMACDHLSGMAKTLCQLACQNTVC